MRAFLPLLALLIVPTATAAITIERVEVPERTMADKPFPVNVTLANDGEARSVYLFAALYERQGGAGPCGSAADPRFRTFTHLVQEAVRVPARTSIVYPDADDQWLQRYSRRDVEAAPATAELCIFVANATTAQRQIDYETFATTTLPVRGINAKPIASFAWDPERPGATRDVRFRAEGSDADGDPVRFAWDFGHINASGRARAQGAVATTFFYPPGDYVVTLTASDGLEESTTARTITIVAAGEEAPPRRGLEVPGAAALVAIVAILVASRTRRR